MPLTCAVVSDIHCHPSSEEIAETNQFSDALRTPVHAHPVASLLKTIKEESLSADILLVPGDITNKMHRQGLVTGWQLIKEIADSLSVSALFATPGNHEIERGAGDPLAAAKSLDPAAYPVACSELASSFWGRGFCICVKSNYRVVLVNSVQNHSNDEELKRGRLTESMLEQIEEELLSTNGAMFNIAMVHHHPMPHEGLGLGTEDLLVQGSELLRMLERQSFQLVVHGHKHYPRISYAQGGSSAPTVLAAGSFAALGRMLTNTRNLFHVLTLSEDELSNCFNPGWVRSWQYSYLKGWGVPAEESSDFPPVAGFGFRGNPVDLALRTESWVTTKESDCVTWEELVDRIPEVQFMLPSDMERYSDVLRSKGFDIYRSRPASRRIIGRVV